MSKKCSTCGKIKPLSEFHKRKDSPDGYRNQCKYCYTERAKSRPNFVERQRAYWRKYYKKNRMEESKRQREKAIKLRKEAQNKLGGRCIKCGYSDWRALCADHINGGGYKERKEISGHGIWRKIRDGPIEEIKKEYQLLCSNCNMIKKIENKECGGIYE